MHQRDYILRIIEQLGAALVELRRRILRQEDTAGVRAALAQASSQAGFDIALLRGFDLSALVLLVRPTGEVDPTRCWVMAELLYLDGLEAHLSDRDGLGSLLKARGLFELIRPAGSMLVGMPEAAERIAEIDELLDDPEGEVEALGARRQRWLKTTPRAPLAGSTAG